MYLQAGLWKQFNAFEMALLFFMCSFYWSVDSALLRLYRTIVLKNRSTNYTELYNKLSRMLNQQLKE